MEVAQFSIELLALIFVVAIIAGFLDTLAGGGGLITIPALILTGLPPLAALATNKLQGSMGTATATFFMLKNKKISWAEVKPLMLSAFVGAAIGTMIVQFIDAAVLSFVIPAVLFIIAVYFLISPKPKKRSNTYEFSNGKYKKIVIPSIGFYDGMFGPGTGSFFALAGVICKRYDLVIATAIAKPLNFSTNIASLLVFIYLGQVVWLLGLLMMLGQVAGAFLGAHFLFKINSAYLRWLVVIMCSSMLLKYCLSMW